MSQEQMRARYEANRLRIEAHREIYDEALSFTHPKTGEVYLLRWFGWKPHQDQDRGYARGEYPFLLDDTLICQWYAWPVDNPPDAIFYYASYPGKAGPFKRGEQICVLAQEGQTSFTFETTDKDLREMKDATFRRLMEVMGGLNETAK